MKRPLNLHGKHAIGLLFLFNLTLLLLASSGSTPASNPPAANQADASQNAAIAEYEPALAVRASACITCHAKIKSSYITDFGYGDRYFFGHTGSGKLGPFSGHTYGDFYGGEPNKTAWLTAEIEGKIIVPRAVLDFDLGSVAGKQLESQSNYGTALQAKSLAGYLQAVENLKANPSKVIEKSKVFIGAPDAATLEARFGIEPGSDTKLKFIKSNSRTSPDISGIGLSSDKGFYTNNGEVVCDGDLLIRGMLFLNHATVATNDGCRIYATGPIFLQNAVTFNSLNGGADRTNLQLVSSEAILLGIGDKSCASAAGASPLATRFKSSYALASFITRDADRKSIPPKTVAQNLYDQARRVPSLEDASCHDETLGFSRILLNAPQVHCRYKGNFKGLVIAEFALFRLGNSSFEFDPVFKDVPVLPILKESDYLQIQ